MKRYKVNITLTDGRKVRSSVIARNQSDALRRLERTKQFVDFLNEQPNAEIQSVDIEPIPIESVDNNRFVVSAVENKKGWYVCADLDNRIKIEWKKGYFVDKQNVALIDGANLDEMTAATALREIADYLLQFFSELL